MFHLYSPEKDNMTQADIKSSGMIRSDFGIHIVLDDEVIQATL